MSELEDVREARKFLLRIARSAQRMGHAELAWHVYVRQYHPYECGLVGDRELAAMGAIVWSSKTHL